MVCYFNQENNWTFSLPDYTYNKSLSNTVGQYFPTKSQFHQRFSRAFIADILSPKKSCSFSLVTFWLWRKDFGKKALSYKKCAHKMLMKVTHGDARGDAKYLINYLYIRVLMLKVPQRVILDLWRRHKISFSRKGCLELQNFYQHCTKNTLNGFDRIGSWAYKT